ncbi:MAG: hypothetical protein IPH77_14410 [Ignavibacteria bacterium]|nr:hypothetical protein [Ignavibacteria bacterium]
MTVIIIIVGLVSLYPFPRIKLQSITIPNIFVSTAYFGVSPQDIESLVS